MSDDTEQIAIKVAGEFRLFCAREGITLPYHAEVRLKSLWATSIRSAIACERELNQKDGNTRGVCPKCDLPFTDLPAHMTCHRDTPERSSHSGSVEHRCERCSGSGRNNLDGECIACDGTGFMGPKSETHLVSAPAPSATVEEIAREAADNIGDELSRTSGDKYVLHGILYRHITAAIAPLQSELEQAKESLATVRELREIEWRQFCGLQSRLATAEAALEKYRSCLTDWKEWWIIFSKGKQKGEIFLRTDQLLAAPTSEQFTAYPKGRNKHAIDAARAKEKQ